MLQAHSFLWHYLWIAPNVLLMALAAILWKRGLHRQYPFFFAFAILGSIEQLTLYAADITPSVHAETWWHIFWGGLLVEALLKFALIGEIFGQAFDSYRSIAKLSKILIRGVGVTLVLVAAVAAAYAPKDSPYGIISGAHVLEQTVYLIESGLLLFIFLFSAYFRLTFSRQRLGIALGLAISACVHLATWAVLANSNLPAFQRIKFDFLNMAVYQVCVGIWFYYLLVPQKAEVKPTISLPDNTLAAWNRELERLLQQ